MRKLGAHVSTAGGIDKAIERVVAIGGNVAQIFSSSPRMWFAGMPDKSVTDNYVKLATEQGVVGTYIHAKYLINLASPKIELIEKSMASLKYDLKVGEMIKAEGVIVHLGSHLGAGFEAVKDQLVKHIKKVINESPGQVEFIIENSAGQKGKIASQLSEIRFLLESVKSDRLSWCLDSCHAWAAGYSLGENSGNILIGNDIVEEAEKLGILDKLKVIHLNDSRDEFGSGRDRHDNLGAGLMGEKVVASYVNHPELSHLPIILEVPGFDGKGPDKKNLEILKSWIE